MSFETGDAKRYKEVIDVCLKKFIEKGLYETTSRDLGAALKLKQAACIITLRAKMRLYWPVRRKHPFD